jgi:hypothetical protein
MRLEAGFVRLPMHEFLGAADAADQKELSSCWSRSYGLARVVGRAHGAYLNGWRKASPAFSPGTGNTSRHAVRLSATTICVLSVSRSHSSETT